MTRYRMGMAYFPTGFEKTMERIALPEGGVLAVAVSGGPDSMALLHLVSGYAKARGFGVAAFTVDHGLRAESADEAQMVGEHVRISYPHVTHQTLFWEGEKPDSRVLEEARAARYALLSAAMERVGAAHLCVAHHRDDQAETFLIRLAKGSGLDGLSGMRDLQAFGTGQWIVRPLLEATKADLVAICDEQSIPYVNDPTNGNKDYLRPRLRAAQAILEEEGLSAKRLSVTARRMLRAREALESLAADLERRAAREGKDGGVTFDSAVLKQAPEELVLRVFLRAMEGLRPDAAYAPRMEKAEHLLDRFLHDENFNGATLGGCVFAIDRKNGTVWIGKEAMA